MNQFELQEILQKEYNRQNWFKILKEVFPKVDLFNIPAKVDAPKEPAKQINQLGSIELNDYKRLGIFEVELNPNVQISRNRVALRNLIVPLIDQEKINGALTIYYINKEEEYRFSFISRLTEFDEDGKISKTETHPKRFTYVLGPNQSCRTAAERFYSLKENRGIFIELNDVIDAFSVDKLTKEFFEQYSNHYKEFLNYLVNSPYLKTVFKIETNTFKSTEDEELKPVREFVKLLLGRVVFIYFLQKKGWMGCSKSTQKWKDGDPWFIKNFFSNFNDKHHFYSKGLSVLFFNALNTKRDNDIFSLTDSRVPYLNGGLFENDFEKGNQIDFPPDLFSELFKFFDSYNFTIDESAPNDHEVGIDPEMLGHIFENLLEDNKDKGSYYTPKEIVHYMCQQSLLRFLKNKLIPDDNSEKEEAEKALDNFVINKDKGDENNRNNFIRQNAKRIEEVIDNIKICDPAIGSGAFPMGLLKELFDIKLTLDWTLDPTETKKKIIQNSIYGVDIDKGAVDIARLRFWLSLVVDEDNPSPLPNFDYKIMQGDSLRESFRGIDFEFDHRRLLENLESEKDTNLFGEANEPQYTLDELLNAQAKAGKFNIIEKEKELFSTYDPQKKKEIRKEVSEIEKDFIRIRIEIERKQTRSELIELNAKLESQSHQKRINSIKRDIQRKKNRLKFLAEVEQEVNHINPDDKPYFLWHLYFMDVFKEGGFDILIANPPYIRADSKNPKHKQFRKELEESGKYETLYEKWDVFVPFIEKGLKFLREDGVLVYITSNALCTSKYAEKLLEYIQQNHTTFILDYFEKMFVFEGVGVIPTISGYIKGNKKDVLVRKQIHKNAFQNIISKNLVPIDDFKNSEKNGFRKEYEPIPVKIKSNSLGNICYISKGMVIHSEERKFGQQFSKDDLISDTKDNTHSRKYLEAKWIKRYKIEKHKYLEWNTERVPYKLSRPTFPELYDKPKLLRGATVGAIYDTSNYLCNHSIFVFVRFCDLAGIKNRSIKNSIAKFNQLKRYELEKRSENYSYKYLLAIINSKFAYHFLNNIRRHRLENYFYPDDFRRLPIPITSKENQDKISILVDYISFLKEVDDGSSKMNLMISFTDQIIDGCVYELFFPDKFEQKGWSLLNKLIDLEPIEKINDRDKKLKIITGIFERYYNQQSPVNIIISNLKSIEYVNKIEVQYSAYNNNK